MFFSCALFLLQAEMSLSSPAAELMSWEVSSRHLGDPSHYFSMMHCLFPASYVLLE